MADLQFTISEEKIQAMLFGERGMEVLTEALFNQLLQAEMTEHLGAAPGEQTKNRRGYRNGSYKRKLTSRVGTLCAGTPAMEVPRDREGTFKTELFERYQRNEKALVLTLMEMVVQGVSTRKVKKITDELCGRRFSRQTVSRLAQKLDGQVQAWAERKLEGSYPFLIVDAMHVKVRRQQAVRSTTVMIAVGISEEGYREILGLKVGFSETGEGWRALFSDLKARGLSGVEMLTSDAHDGLRGAAQQSFPGAIWQRCQAHFRRNVADRVPAASKERIHEMLDSILEAPSPADAREALERAATELQEMAPAALEVLDEGFEDATAALALPEKYRRRLRTTNIAEKFLSVERFIEEIRRREKVVRIFPNMQAAWRLIGALCAEQHEEWAHGRRYLTMEAYVRWKAQLENAERHSSNPLPKAA